MRPVQNRGDRGWLPTCGTHVPMHVSIRQCCIQYAVRIFQDTFVKASRGPPLNHGCFPLEPKILIFEPLAAQNNIAIWTHFIPDQKSQRL